MYAVIGTLFLAISILGFAVFMLVSRKPNPPAWSGLTIVHEVAAIGIVSLAGFGASFLLQNLGALDKQPLTVTHLIVIGAIVAVFVAAWIRLKVRKTLASYVREADSATPPSRPVSPLQPKKAA
jgi:cation transport ATPase